MYKIMIVDDEENILKSLQRTLSKKGDLDIESYLNAKDALKRCQTCIFDAVISDCRMPGMDGIDFLYELKQLQPDSIRILLTGAVDITTLMRAINRAGAFRFIAKPWDDNVLIESLSEGLRYRDILFENRMLADKVREQEDRIKLMKQGIEVQ